jgi:hypothetical protein
VATYGRIVAVAGISASGVLQYGEVYVLTTAGRVMTWLTEGRFLPPGGLVGYSSVSISDAGDIFAGGFVQTALVSGPDFFCGYYEPFGGTHLLTRTGDTDGWDLCNTVLVAPDGTAYAAGSIANATTGQDVFLQACDPGWHSRFQTTYSPTGQPASNDQATGLALRGGYLYVAGVSAGRLLLLKYVR